MKVPKVTKSENERENYRKVTPKVTSNDPQRRPNGPQKATNGAQ